MDSQTLELFRWLQSGPYDEGGLERIRSLLQAQRRLLRSRNDLATLTELIELLTGWAENAADPQLSTLAMLEASDIAERELRQPERAAQLRAQASADADQRDAERQSTSFATLGARRAEAGDLDGAIEAYDKALDADVNVEVIYALADLYTQRSGPGDAEQAADLYCTLGDVLGNPDGITMLERALALQPKHADARALFDTYVASQPAVPAHAYAQSAPRMQPPPLAAAQARQATPQATSAGPQRSAAPAITAPKPRGWSSLPPIVVEDAQLLDPKRAGWRWLVAGSVLTAVSAAGLVFAISTGRLESGKTVISRMLVTLGVSSQPASLPAHPDTPPMTPTAAVTALPPGGSVPGNLPNEPAAIDKPGSVTGDAPQTTAPATPAPGDTPSAVAAVAPEPSVSPSTDAPSPATTTLGTAQPQVHALVEQATLRGGKLSDTQLSAAIDKVTPKLERCYATTLKDKPKAKGKLTFSWTVRPNGKATSVKAVGGSIKDNELGRCTADVISAMHFPKPKKKAAQIKLAFEYRSTS